MTCVFVGVGMGISLMFRVSFSFIIFPEQQIVSQIAAPKRTAGGHARSKSNTNQSGTVLLDASSSFWCDIQPKREGK
jgi:uncharacterized membrane protein